AKAGKIGRAPHSAAVDGMARLAAVRAAAGVLPRLSGNLHGGRIRAGDIPDPASWQEMKVRHPRYYRHAGPAAASRGAPGSTNHASCGRAVYTDSVARPRCEPLASGLNRVRPRMADQQ